jgi:putative endonuclease
MDKNYFVYILTNKYNKVLYIGVTNDLAKRVYQHKEKMVEGFTKKYNLNKLVYYEIYNEVKLAISREKQLKGITRQKKIDAINSLNRSWKDLYEETF